MSKQSVKEAERAEQKRQEQVVSAKYTLREMQQTIGKLASARRSRDLRRSMQEKIGEMIEGDEVYRDAAAELWFEAHITALRELGDTTSTNREVAGRQDY